MAEVIVLYAPHDKPPTGLCALLIIVALFDIWMQR